MKRIRKAVLVSAFLALLLSASMIVIPVAAKTPSIVFVNAWFGDVNNKIEVEPGDKAVQLVVQLVHSGDEFYRYVEGTLNLPEGFEDSATGARTTRASVVQQVLPGSYFYLKFLIDIGDDVKIGEHTAKLLVKYAEWDEDDQETEIHQKLLEITFRVTGKSWVRAVLSGDEVEPAKRRDLKIILDNRGSAEASAVEAWVEALTPGLAILTGQGRHIVGDLSPGVSKEIPITVLASRAIADTVGSIKVTLTYLNSYGLLTREDYILSIKVKPLGGVGVVLDAYAVNPILNPAERSKLEVVVTNRGTEEARDVDLRIELPQLPNPPITLIEGATAVKLGDLAPGAERRVALEVFVNELASGKSYSIPISLTYVDEEGRHLVESGLTVTVLEESRRNRLRIYSEEYVKGGTIEEVNITVENIAGGDLEDITLTLSPMVSWVTLLGPTTWNLQSLASGEKTTLKLKMYVPSETASGSTIGEPFNLKVDASFREEGGQIRNEAHILGMYVKGIIELRLQELSVERLGKDLLLVGRILNEGTEKASYTQIKLMGGDLQSTTVSYLGDVEPNAPILFNIPIEKVLKKDGKAAVELEVTYQDSLRQKGETVLRAEVELPSLAEESGKSQAGVPFSEVSLLVLIVVVAAVVIAVYFARRSRRVEAA